MPIMQDLTIELWFSISLLSAVLQQEDATEWQNRYLA